MKVSHFKVGLVLLKRREARKTLNEKIEINDKSKDYTLSNSLEMNINLIKEIFNNDDTIKIRMFDNQENKNIKYCILFVEYMINSEIINENIIKPLMLSSSIDSNNRIDSIMNHVIVSNNVEKTSNVNMLVESIINGDTVLIIEGVADALIISSKGWKTRSIEEPLSEKVLRGPREGFTESLMLNLSLIRRKLSTPDLKFKFRVLGVISKTKICLCYIDGIVNNKILDELNERLDKIDIDGILDSGYIQELIRDSPLSPFKTIGNTERPDVVAAKLLEGRIAIIVDGTPFVLTVPHIFIENFQTSEDYYVSFYFASINRTLRILSFILSFSLPGVFVALISFHQEMLPTPLILSISAARQSVPLPASIEILSLLIVFQILRETGIRMNPNIGQALSIVGALVIGQAAVEARIISAPMVIMVALTGITEFAVPRMSGSSILLMLILLFLSSILGLYGFIFGVIGLLIHLFEIRSFGVPYMLGSFIINPEDIKDTFIRSPRNYMKYRPKFIAKSNRIRNNSGGRK